MNLLEHLIKNPQTAIVPNNALIGSQVAWTIQELIHVSPAMYELLNDTGMDNQELYFIAQNIEVTFPPKTTLVTQLIISSINKELQQRFKKIHGEQHVTR
jgi:hypothetical protein